MKSELRQICVKAYAKINVGLEIVGRFSDGFHALDTLMTSVSLFDTVKITETDEAGIEVFSNVPISGVNTAKRAAEKIDFFIAQSGQKMKGLRIEIEKNIPIGAGLGGSSADAAAVFFGLSKLYGLLPSEAVMGAVGSDVPFMVAGGAARCKEKGNLTEKIDVPQTDVLVVVPDFSLSSADAYKEYDRLAASSSTNKEGGKSENLMKASASNCETLFEESQNITKLLKEWQAGDIAGMSKFLRNDLFSAAESLKPEMTKISNFIAETINLYAKDEAAFSMTGSGSAFVVLCKNAETKSFLLPMLSQKYRTLDLKTVKNSVEICN